jgi:predicted PurR-regulated permease PerM
MDQPDKNNVNDDSFSGKSTSPAAPLVIHMPVDVRSASLAMLAVLALVYTLHWASPVFIPIVISWVCTYALSPVVDFLEKRLRLSRWIAAGLLLLVLGGAVGWTAQRLYGSAIALVDGLPAAALKIKAGLQKQMSGPGSSSTIESLQKTATQLEEAAKQTATHGATRSGATRVIVEPPAFNVREHLWHGTLGLVHLAGQLVLVAFLTFFSLGCGKLFRRKLVRIAGKSLEKKKITVHVLDDVTSYIEKYLIAQWATSVVVGVASGLAFAAMGLEHAAVWGVIAGVTNLIPYLGSVAVMAASGAAAFLQFGEVRPAVAIMAASLVVHTLVGNLLLPWLTGRHTRMNPVAVFAGMIFWGWLWGLWGLLLGLPILMMIKALCDHVEDIQPIGELLSS